MHVYDNTAAYVLSTQLDKDTYTCTYTMVCVLEKGSVCVCVSSNVL